MWIGMAEAAPVEVGLEREDEAMGHGIQAFPCDHAGLLQITQRIPLPIK